MAQQADIVAYDGAATPVAHTLVGAGVSTDANGVSTAVWKETLAGVPEIAQITYTQIRTRLKSGVTRVVARLEVPVMEAVSGTNSSGYTAPPKVANVERFEDVGYISPRSIETNRRIGMQLLNNIVNGVTTSTTINTTSPAALLFQKLIQVT